MQVSVSGAARPVEARVDGHDPHARLAALSQLATGQMELVDALTRGSGEGPCITAATQARMLRSGSLDTDPLWPIFGPHVGCLGVHSTLSIPLVTPGGVLRAMNIYARERDAFDDRSGDRDPDAGIGCDSAEAFERLRHTSQSENQKLRAVAHRLVGEAVRRGRERHTKT